MNGSDGQPRHVQDLAWVRARVRLWIVGARSEPARRIELRGCLQVRAGRGHRARVVTATGEAREAVLPAPVAVAVAADLLARVAEHDVREADRVGQREREHEDAREGHVQAVAWSTISASSLIAA